MLCAVIKGRNFTEIYQQIANLKDKQMMIEIRFDYVQEWDQAALENLRKHFPNPMLFSVRTFSQRGEFIGSSTKYRKLNRRLAEIKPDYLDIEYSAGSSEFVEEIRKAHPEIKIILTHHDFEKMPDLPLLYEEMRQVEADFYMMIVMPHSSAEALYLLHFMKKNAPKVIAIGMGSYGKVTRILSPAFGGAFIYSNTSSETQTGLGQVPLTELLYIYNHNYLTLESDVYGLIGDPVDKSIGHLSHNRFLHHLDQSSVYVKFQTTPQELPSLLRMAKIVGIKGLSVTMPLKEAIIPYLDEIDHFAKKAGAVNTVVFEGTKAIGYNTDGKGAMDAIESKMLVKDKKMIFIGAGGAVKAVAAEAISRGAEVVILNRTPERAMDLAHYLGCRGGSLDLMPSVFAAGYDILVNATPDAMPIKSDWIIPGCLVMDFTTQPKQTTFLKNAEKKNCTVVFGYEMFVGQAVGQFRLWFGDLVDEKQAHQILNKTVNNFL